MSKPTKRRREIERLFALRERDGLSLRELSQRSGIPVGTLSWWSNRLRVPGPAFTEVQVVGEPSSEPPEGEPGRPLLRLRMPNGLMAEFEGELAQRAAARLIEELARWS